MEGFTKLEIELGNSGGVTLGREDCKHLSMIWTQCGWSRAERGSDKKPLLHGTNKVKYTV